MQRECHHDTVPVYAPVTSDDPAPSLWSGKHHYATEADYRGQLEAWFNAQMVTHTTGELSDRGWCHHDAEILLDHLGRDSLHCARDRSSISKAWSSTRDKHGRRTPLVWPRERAHLAEYIHFTNPSFAAVIVIDVDHVGAPGGRPSDLSLDVAEKAAKLAHFNLGPNWVGINPESGKSQLIWYIDPVYRTQGSSSRPWALLEALHAELQGYFEADKNFAHGWSRNPIYAGDNLGAYCWYAQHHEVFHMRLLSAGLWMLQGETVATIEDKGVNDRTPTQRFSSGRELINAARANTERARQARAVLAGLEDEELSEAFAAADPDVIDGVRVIWQSPGRAQRDVTAFQHALKTGGRLHRAGKKMTDDAIIDAYRQAYEVAHSVGADGRAREEPPMKDLRSLARRVRGYVSSNKRPSHAGATEGPATGYKMSSSERKALATLGRRGAATSNARRWSDPQSPAAQASKTALEKINARKQASSRIGKRTVENVVDEYQLESGRMPTLAELVRATGLSQSTVQRHLKRAGIALPRGRRPTQ